MPGGWARNWRGLSQEVANSAKPSEQAALVLRAAELVAAVNVVCAINPDFAVVHA